MRLKPVELFLALGLAATVTACGGATEQGGEGGEATTSPAPAATTSPAEGGEGGEGVSPSPTASPSPTTEGGEGGEGGEG